MAKKGSGRNCRNRIGLKDVAGQCGLSLNTVSDILNRGRAGLYRDDTVAAVTKAARELGYRPNRAAQAMRSKRTRVAGFLTENFSRAGNCLANHVVYPFLIGASHFLVERDYHIALVELDEVEFENPDQPPQVLTERFFDGLIIHFGVSEMVQSAVRTLEIPAIWWDSGSFDARDCIYRDEETVGFDLTEELLNLGHRRIAFSGHDLKGEQPGRHFSTPHRHRGYQKAMRKAGLEPLSIESSSDDDLVARLSSLKPTAVVILGLGGSEQLAMFGAAARLGWKIPEDLSVATCDREALIGVPYGGFTYDRYSTGRQAAAMLLKKLEDPDLRLDSVKVTGEFKPGKTIGPCRDCV